MSAEEAKNCFHKNGLQIFLGRRIFQFLTTLLPKLLLTKQRGEKHFFGRIIL
jgi:hypothetical protein